MIAVLSLRVSFKRRPHTDRENGFKYISSFNGDVNYKRSRVGFCLQ